MIRRLIAGALIAVSFLPAQAQSCETEDACLAAYASATVDRDIPIDLSMAGSALRQGCELRQTGKSCRILSFLIKRGAIEGSEQEQHDLTRKGCEAGDRIACRFVAIAWLTEETWSAPRTDEYRQIRRVLENGCASGDDYLCRKLVRYVSADDAKRYQARCDEGETTYCALLGGQDFYPYHQHKEDARRAEEIFRGQCQAGNGMACVFLADLLGSGHGTDLTEDRRPHLLHACSLGVGHGCDVIYGQSFSEDFELPHEAALTMLQTSCGAGNPMACVERARIIRWENNDTKIAYAHALRDDCLIGNLRSCTAAAKAFEGIRRIAKLDEKFDDVDQMVQNYFDFAEALKK